MKTKWNVDPEAASTLLRLISELEGSSYLLDCLDDTEEEYEFIRNMIKKYYKLYFRHPNR
tara:strand:+ start:459 stop:638 length:180 start_codon:yes stop_codon:yes gene_type:complete